ncbi:YezD family protein [Neobacillus sp. SCS-31]|uniref:YezD family protein n=1 Tax=Neobacillus oceani TaxID=3115292 RepID=UPI0039061EC9
MSGIKLQHDVIIEKIRDLLNGLEYGTILITVHDSRVTQIDKLEKHRIPTHVRSSVS